MKRQKKNKYEASYTRTHDYHKMSYKELRHDFFVMTKQANAILDEVTKKGLRKYGTAYIRKYNTMLATNDIKNLGSATGRFSTRLGTKENLIKRMRILDQFIDNPAVYAEKIDADIRALADRLGFKSTTLVTELFDIWREYGFEDYKDDSDRLLIAFAEVSNKGGDMDRFARFLRSMEQGHDQEYVVRAAENFRDYYNAKGNWLDSVNFARDNANNEEKTEEQRMYERQAELHRTLGAKERLK